jgi:hypothetical protein
MADKENMSQSDGGFFSRWSRRKRQAESENDGSLDEPHKGEPVEATVSEENQESEEQKANREAAEAIDIDALTYESDFTVFLKSGVPEFLRRKAMRKLWSSNPVLANLDGLNDYDDNYADPKFNVFKSAWSVVGGYLGSQEAPKEDKQIAKSDPSEGLDTGAKSVGPGDDRESDAELERDALEANSETDSADGVPDDKIEGEAEPARVSLRRRLEG